MRNWKTMMRTGKNKYLILILLGVVLTCSCNQEETATEESAEAKVLIDSRNVEPYKVNKSNDRDLYNTKEYVEEEGVVIPGITTPVHIQEAVHEISDSTGQAYQIDIHEEDEGGMGNSELNANANSDSNSNKEIMVEVSPDKMTVIDSTGKVYRVDMNNIEERKSAALLLYPEGFHGDKEGDSSGISDIMAYISDTAFDYTNFPYQIEVYVNNSLASGDLYNIPDSMIDLLQNIDEIEMDSRVAGLRRSTVSIFPEIDSTIDISTAHLMTKNLQEGIIYIDMHGRIVIAVSSTEYEEYCYPVGIMQQGIDKFKAVGPGLIKFRVSGVIQKMN